MKIITHEAHTQTYVLRLDRGEELKETLAQFCKDNSITAGYFSGIGSTDDCTLAYYDPAQKIYVDHQFSHQHEVVTIQGNISMCEGKHVIHAHAVISGSDLIAKGGHVQKLVTYITNEIFLRELGDEVLRAHDTEHNLYLLK